MKRGEAVAAGLKQRYGSTAARRKDQIVNKNVEKPDQFVDKMSFLNFRRRKNKNITQPRAVLAQQLQVWVLLFFLSLFSFSEFLPKTLKILFSQKILIDSGCLGARGGWGAKAPALAARPVSSGLVTVSLV